MKQKILLFLFSGLLVFVVKGQSLTPLTGVYSINPSIAASATNYQSFGALATDLNTVGISGNVTVNVKQGTYLENFELNDILGTSVLYKIIIQANVSNTAPVILSNQTYTTSSGTVKLTGTKFITFKGIHFTSLQTLTYTRMVYMTGTLSDVYFEDCEFILPLVSTTSTAYSVFYGNGFTMAGNGLSLKNCKSTGGSSFMYGYSSSSARSSKLTFHDCEMIDGYGYWIYGYYWDEYDIQRNKFYPQSITATSYAIYLYNAAGTPGKKVNIQRNDIRVNASGIFYGMYMSYFSSLATDPSLIANNFIQNTSSGSISTRYMLYLTDMANLDISHNTLKVNDGSPTTSRIFYFLKGSASAYVPGFYRIRNNILNNNVTGSGGNLIYASGAASGYISTISNNIYHAPNSTQPFYYNTAYHATLASWATASGDQNSLSGDPQFLGPTNLHVEGILASGNGVNLANVTNDFDGQNRPLPAATNVDIGADEFIPPTCPTPVNLSFAGGSTSSATFSWTSVMSSQWELQYGPFGFSPGTGTKVIVNSNPATLTGLNPQQFYEVYIRSICGVGDTSNYNGPVVFNTFGQGIYMDADTACGPGFIDISSTGIDLNLTDDSEAGIVLPFPWLVQGMQVSTITVGNNGGLLFNTLTGNVAYDMSSGKGMYPFIQDLDNDIAGVNQVGVLWDVLGTAPNRQFVLMWKNRTRYPGSTNTNPVTFELIYEEASSEFYYTYPDVNFGNPTYDNGADAEIGVRGPNQDINISINNSTYLTENSCVHFFYTNCPKPTNFVLAFVDTTEAFFTWTPGISNENSWRVVFGPAGFDPNTSGTSFTVSSTMFQIPNLNINTKYEVYIYALCASGDTSFALFGTFKTNPRCGSPYDFLSKVGMDSLISKWEWNNQYQAFYPLTGFNLYYGEDLMQPHLATKKILGTSLNDTTYDVNFLPGGVYDVYIQAQCSSYTSDTIGPIKLVMPLTNDLPCFAHLLPVDGNKRVFSNQAATIDQNEQNIAPPVTGNRRRDGWADSGISHSTWFTFVAPASGNVRIDARDRDFDGQIAVYKVGNCGVYNSSYQLKVANDDAIPLAPGDSSVAPNFTVCELIPGQTYYLMHDSRYSSQSGIYSLRLSEINLTAGSAIGDTIKMCLRDTLNLYTGLNSYTSGGFWLDVDLTAHIIRDSLFNSNGMQAGQFTFEYRVTDGCAYDSAQFEVAAYPHNYAGTDGVKSICRKQPFNLLSTLGGLVDHGGKWYNPDGSPRTNGNVLTGEIQDQGTYQYMYIVDNGVCPADTSYVIITAAGCDYTGIDEMDVQSLKVFPNPASEKVFMTWEEGVFINKVELLDFSGRLIKTLEIESGKIQSELEVNDLARGMYTLRLSNKDGFVSRRLSIE